jgi:predicted dehydrogenase
MKPIERRDFLKAAGAAMAAASGATAADVEGCERIMRAADAADRKLNITMGFQRPYAQVYLKAKALHDSGAIGGINMAHAHFLKSGGSPEP